MLLDPTLSASEEDPGMVFWALLGTQWLIPRSPSIIMAMIEGDIATDEGFAAVDKVIGVRHPADVR